MKYKMRDEDIQMFRDGDYKKFEESLVMHNDMYITWDLKYTPYPTAIKCPICSGVAVKSDDSSDYICVNPDCDFKYLDACDHSEHFIFTDQIED